MHLFTLTTTSFLTLAYQASTASIPSISTNSTTTPPLALPHQDLLPRRNLVLSFLTSPSATCPSPSTSILAPEFVALTSTDLDACTTLSDFASSMELVTSDPDYTAVFYTDYDCQENGRMPGRANVCYRITQFKSYELREA